MMTQSKRVALCVTCTIDQFMPEVGVSTVKLLRRAGYEVDFPKAQTCCGQPFYNSGFRDEARHLAKRTIAAFSTYEIVVLPGGSCTTMIRKEYAHLFEDDPVWAERARQFAAKTYELNEFLVHIADWEIPKAEQSKTITYHDSCHMSRMLGLRKEPRQTLTSAGCEIVEMAESDRCCGFGGLFCIRMPEVSNAMTGEKLNQAEATQSPLLVTSDPGCLMQMRGLVDDKDFRIEHTATVLEEMTR